MRIVSFFFIAVLMFASTGARAIEYPTAWTLLPGEGRADPGDARYFNLVFGKNISLPSHPEPEARVTCRVDLLQLTPMLVAFGFTAESFEITIERNSPDPGEPCRWLDRASRGFKQAAEARQEEGFVVLSVVYNVFSASRGAAPGADDARYGIDFKSFGRADRGPSGLHSSYLLGEFKHLLDGGDPSQLEGRVLPGKGYNVTQLLLGERGNR